MTSERELPEDSAPYSQTRWFTASSMPAKLGKDHRTKPGVWGKIHVKEGQVRYFLQGASDPLMVLDAGTHGIVLPEETHFVEVSDDVEFCVEFWKRAESTLGDDEDPHAPSS